MIAPALQAIAADLREIAEDIQSGFPADPFNLRLAATRIEAQAEMLAKHLTGDEE